MHAVEHLKKEHYDLRFGVREVVVDLVLVEYHLVEYHLDEERRWVLEKELSLVDCEFQR